MGGIPARICDGVYMAEGRRDGGPGTSQGMAGTSAIER